MKACLPGEVGPDRLESAQNVRDLLGGSGGPRYHAQRGEILVLLLEDPIGLARIIRAPAQEVDRGDLEGDAGVVGLDLLGLE